MLRSENRLRTYTVTAEQEHIGSLKELLFDDEAWIVQYLVVDVGSWLKGREVIVSPQVFQNPDHKNNIYPTRITKDEIQTCPEFTEDRPVSRTMQPDLLNVFGWRPYREPAQESGPTVERAVAVEKDRRKMEPNPPSDPHLRSTREIEGYHIQAADGGIGHIDDFLVDDRSWAVRYLVVDTRNLIPGGKKVLLSPEWVRRIDWSERSIVVDVTRDRVENSPEYDPDQPVDREYETRLYGYYDRPMYWR